MPSVGEPAPERVERHAGLHRGHQVGRAHGHNAREASGGEGEIGRRIRGKPGAVPSRRNFQPSLRERRPSPARRRSRAPRGGAPWGHARHPRDRAAAPAVQTALRSLPLPAPFLAGMGRAPDQYVIIRKVPYPDDVLEDELKGHFFIEIGSTLYLPFDDPVFDVVPYIPNTETNEAIVIASKESVLDLYEDVLKDVKLDPVTADITPLALYRLAYKQHALTGEEHVLLADLKEDKMTVSIFHAHYPLFMRPVELENAAVLSVVADIQEQRITPATIVMELEKLINFYRYNMWNGTASITHLLVNGDMTGLMNCFRLSGNGCRSKRCL